MMKSIGFLSVLLCTSSVAAASDDGADIETAARAALQQLAQQQDSEFSYQRRSQMGDNSKLERFQSQAAEGEQWQLLSENGQSPSAARLREYRQMRLDEAQTAEQQDDDQQQGVKLSLSNLVQQDTLSYQQPTQWRNMKVQQLNFVPQLDKFSEHNEKLQGHLYMSQDGQQLEGIQITLKESFSPATSVTLENFQLIIELTTVHGDQGQSLIVPEQTEEIVAGSYLFFKDFNNHTVRYYSDYQLASTPAEDNSSAKADNASMP